MVYCQILLLISLGISLSSHSCEVGKDFCLDCHFITNLCTKCEYNILVPDEQGGCKGSKKCSSGKNYCSECNEDNILCKECEIGFYLDNNGGCSYTENCEI